VDWSLSDAVMALAALFLGEKDNVGLASPRESRVLGRAGAGTMPSFIVYRLLEV
jgi:hypothetical protein